MQMMASLLKEMHKGEKHFHVAIMPCTAKKFEAAREEFEVDGVPNVDAVLTTKGLIRMIKEAGIQFDEIEPEAVDMPFSTVSGAGVIFGVTGGVTEAVLRRVSENKSRGNLLTLATLGQRGSEGIKEFDIPYGDKTLHVAVVSGLGNAEKVIKRMQAGEHFDFIEVMACPGGCVNGGGQPYGTRAQVEERNAGLYKADKNSVIRNAEANPLLKDIYDNIIKGRAHELLHVHYKKK
ncbi:MAG: iron hydrogenase small subunit, partial [Clostridia bacterium]|nr:iron hydrogenase small subunit [Clostridia bacterium]